ncbi:13788_t:CDS:1, partial [Funneliformis mosseae]
SIRRLSKAGTASQEASESSNISTLEVTSERRSSDNPSKKISKVVRSSEEIYMKSRPTIPSTAESHTTSRLVISSFPSFLQSTNDINVTINNNYAGTSEEQEN